MNHLEKLQIGKDSLKEKKDSWREKIDNMKIDLNRIFQDMKDFIDLIKDIWDYLKIRKKYWLAPIIITILLMGALILFTQGSVLAPFIYTIF